VERPSVGGEGDDLQIWALAENALNKQYNPCWKIKTVSMTASVV
jgi:hypothetical protein